ncbi:phosphoribosyltransferase [Saccharomonospora azurea]|uniref:Phosphoribosyltransferase n=1 Tax=Saccharomonospora azurea NA-128 TaxID=882081 RepID=H8G3C3_9PSEU|nr:phosphoribosyltransferase family protein [Saccharomonospora azurea]EHK83188.1 putative phosphoribosyltransferase [Saccharomonospora azurea SZMC 14600]EHY87001.1 putative phosphoribosyltransferase [Saccharomonospora azurea NA-128]
MRHRRQGPSTARPTGTTAARVYADRSAAGRALAAALREHDWVDPVVLGLARGGVPVAAEVAAELGAPLDVFVARKIGAPGRPEFGIGAVTAHGPVVVDDQSVRILGMNGADLDAAAARERKEVLRRLDVYQGGREPERLEGRDVIVIDDGLATGVTATAALRALRREGPRRLAFASPVCAPQAASALRDEADLVLCVSEPPHFQAVGQWYGDFSQTSDDEVVALLDEYSRGAG